MVLVNLHSVAKRWLPFSFFLDLVRPGSMAIGIVCFDFFLPFFFCSLD